MRCASNLACGASYAALLHTRAEEYDGVPEPSLTLCERVSRELDKTLIGQRAQTRPQPGRVPHALSTGLHGLLELSLSSYLAFFAFAPFLIGAPHPSKDAMDGAA